MTDAQQHETKNKELLTNPSFSDGAKGWFLRDATAVSPDQNNDQPTVKLNGVKPGPNSWSHVGISINAIPTNQKLNFSCLLRGDKSGQKLSVNAFAYNAANNLVANWTADSFVDNGAWKQFKATYVAPPEATYLTVWVIDATAYPAYVSRASLQLGGYQKAAPAYVDTDPGATMILRARYQACVRPLPKRDTGVVTFPVPGTYRDQVPLTFDLHVEPPSALIDYRIIKRDDGLNWLCQVNIKSPGKGVIIKWESLVLVSGRKEPTLPKVQPSAPKEVAQWTHSTACVQSADPTILAKSEELAKGTDDVESYVRKVIAFTSKNKGKAGEKFDALDAKRALLCGGSCTSRANLAAALLRAHGIPARTVSHLPAWYTGPLFEHWLVEYWHPTVGWVWIEPTLNGFQPPANDLIVLAVSSPADEDKAFDPVHLRCIMPGAPYLSGFEISEQLTDGSRSRFANSSNSAVMEKQINGTAAEMQTLLEATRKNFALVMNQSKTNQNNGHANAIQTAIQEGKAIDLAAAVLKFGRNGTGE